jgi:hypothetical protein
MSYFPMNPIDPYVSRKLTRRAMTTVILITAVIMVTMDIFFMARLRAAAQPLSP